MPDSGRVAKAIAGAASRVTFGAWLRSLGGLWKSLRRLEAVHEAVVSHLPVLPVVTAQLQDANRIVEQAVSQVSAQFGRMAEQAQEGVGETSRLVSGAGQTGGIEGILSSSRATLEDLLLRIMQDSEISGRLVTRMGVIEQAMATIVRTLADVDRIAFGNSILALNAKIEAAHIGERGAGFEIVAQELWLQAQRSSEITERIRSAVNRLSDDARSAAAEIRGMACSDAARIEDLRREVQHALAALEETHRGMQQSLEEGGRRSEALTAEIGGAIEAMQFQDRVSQRIGHIVEALQSMQEALASPLAGGGRQVDAEPQSTAEAQLAVSYTMQGERDVHDSVLGRQTPAGTGLPDVEIF
jgi:methyl-accepting chemotaxis protein